MNYKTYEQCRRCRQVDAPADKKYCTKCQDILDWQSEAREHPCPICGVDPGYACYTRQLVEELYGGGRWEVRQGDPVHPERHPRWVAPAATAGPVPFWKQAFHYVFRG